MVNNIKHCKNCLISEQNCFILVDGWLDKYGYCVECYLLCVEQHEHAPPEIFARYKVRQYFNSFVCRLDLLSHSGFDVTMVLHPCGKLFVGIERASCFTFRSISDIVPPHHACEYIAEKLCVASVDGYELSKFFEIFQAKLCEVGIIKSCQG